MTAGITLEKAYYPAVQKQKQIIEDLLSEFRKGINAQTIMFEQGDYDALYALYDMTDAVYVDLNREVVRLGIIYTKLKLENEIEPMLDDFYSRLHDILRGDIK